jgi:Domain of unknown function (DUF4142)
MQQRRQFAANIEPEGHGDKTATFKALGEQFDQAYRDHMVTDPAKDVAEFRQETSAKDPDVKNFPSQTLPTLRDHLKQREALGERRLVNLMQRRGGNSWTQLWKTALARPKGLEPLTYGSGGRRSIQLSYGRAKLVYIRGLVAATRAAQLGSECQKGCQVSGATGDFNGLLAPRTAITSGHGHHHGHRGPCHLRGHAQLLGGLHSRSAFVHPIGCH